MTVEEIAALPVGHPDEPWFTGRRVDVLMRDIPSDDDEDTAAAFRRFVLSGKRNSSPWHLAQRPAILVHPELELGRIIWRPQ